MFVLASATSFSPVGMPPEDSSILEDEASAPPVCLSILPSSFAIQKVRLSSANAMELR